MQIFLPLLAWYFEQIYYLYIYTPCWDMTKSVENDGSGAVMPTGGYPLILVVAYHRLQLHSCCTDLGFSLTNRRCAWM